MRSDDEGPGKDRALARQDAFGHLPRPIGISFDREHRHARSGPCAHRQDGLMRFVLTMTAQLGRNHLAYLRKNLRAARAKVKSPLGELSVALVNDRTMSELHREFMKQRGPTDVLTFPLGLDARGMAVA